MAQKLGNQDLEEVYDKIWHQFMEDRREIRSMFHELRGMLSGSSERYAINGDTLAKYAELMTKQTAQLIEFVKTTKKKDEGDLSLSADDLKFVADEIEKEKKK